MTAIAGCVRFGAQDPEYFCGNISEALPRFEFEWRMGRLADAAFAASQSVRVAEDRLDSQPLVVPSRLLLAADIRLDNRSEVLHALGAAQLPRSGDAAILLQAWQRWGPDGLHHLVGDFAFAVFDGSRHTLYLARDPAGQRPLFYTADANAICFASLPSGLLNAARRPATFNRRWIAKKLHGFADIGEETCFETIHRVLPGELVVIDPAGVKRRRFWNPPATRLEGSDEVFTDHYRELLDRAVAARMRSERPVVASQLSSGFDSNAVTATAALLRGDASVLGITSAPRKGFDGAVPSGVRADETDLAAATAEMYGLRHRIVRSSGHPLWLLRGQSLAYQEPDRNVINMDWWSQTLVAARQEGANVILTGIAGNLTLNWGGLAALREWRTVRGLAAWVREARAARDPLGLRWRGILINSFGHRIPARARSRLDRLFRKAADPGETSFLLPEWRKARAQFAAEERRDLDSGDPTADRLAVLLSQDRGPFVMGALIEARVDERDPMADRRIMDFGFALPPEQLLRDGVSRPLMRRALADRLPDAIFANRLRGLQGADWYEHLRVQEMEDILEDVAGSTVVSELVDLDRLRSVIRAWPTGAWDSPRTIGIYRRAVTLTLSTAVFIDEFEQRVRSNTLNQAFPGTSD